MIFKQFILFTFLSFKKYTYLFSTKNKLFFGNTNENEGNIRNNTNEISNTNNISNSSIYKPLFINNINLNYKTKLLKKYNIVIPHHNNTSIPGMDNRFNIYNETSVKNYTEIDKIINNERKKRLLDSLTNPSISQKDKLKLLEDNDILDNNVKVINILKGGLTRDW